MTSAAGYADHDGFTPVDAPIRAIEKIHRSDSTS